MWCLYGAVSGHWSASKSGILVRSHGRRSGSLQKMAQGSGLVSDCASGISV